MTAPISTPGYWDGIYGGKTKAEPGGHEHLRIALVAPHVEGPAVIDIGAGYGATCRALRAAHPAWTITGVDASQVAARASKYHPYVVASIYALPFPDRSVDTALCMQTLEYVEDVPRALQEMRRVAKLGLITVPHGKHATCSQLREYTLSGFSAECASYGTVEHAEHVHSLVFIKLRFT